MHAFYTYFKVIMIFSFTWIGNFCVICVLVFGDGEDSTAL